MWIQGGDMKKLHFRGAIVHKNVQLSKITPIWPLTYTITGGGYTPKLPIEFWDNFHYFQNETERSEFSLQSLPSHFVNNRINTNTELKPKMFITQLCLL